MKTKNISTLERAAGLIEGVSVSLDENISSLLLNAVELIDCVIHDDMLIDALALIREKDKEIEKLQAQYSKVLENTLKSRDEAVREFAERVKANYAVHKVHYVNHEQPMITYQLTNFQLDEIVEEMKGETE